MAELLERRHAARVAVQIPTLIEAIGHREAALHPNLAKVYQRVLPTAELVGESFPGIIRDLSTNGAFIAGPAAPLLSRIAFTFGLEGYGKVEALGWTLWRRTGDCEIPRDAGEPIFLPGGFGVLFEAIPLEAREAIAKLVARGAPLTEAEFRFRPRSLALPWACAVLGPAVLVLALATGASGTSRTFAIAAAVLGPLIVAAYLAAPAWRFRVLAGDDGLAVWHGRDLRFRLSWSEVRKLIHSPSTRTCFVDGGEPKKSLLVPGPGAPAFYRIERSDELYAVIVAHVPEDRRQAVELLELVMREKKTVV